MRQVAHTACADTRGGTGSCWLGLTRCQAEKKKRIPGKITQGEGEKSMNDKQAPLVYCRGMMRLWKWYPDHWLICTPRVSVGVGTAEKLDAVFTALGSGYVWLRGGELQFNQFWKTKSFLLKFWFDEPVSKPLWNDCKCTPATTHSVLMRSVALLLGNHKQPNVRVIIIMLIYLYI